MEKSNGDARPPFERTICDCPKDRANCHRQPGALIPGDLERIADQLEIPNGDARAGALREYFEASPGAIVGRMVGGVLHTLRVPSIVPRRGPDGACIFLKAGRCSVHAVAPFGCAYFDMHMDDAEGNRRSLWGIDRQRFDADYQAMAKALADV